MSGSVVAPWGLLRPNETARYDVTDLLKYMRCEKMFSREEVVRFRLSSTSTYPNIQIDDALKQSVSSKPDEHFRCNMQVD
jgi:hypothetical protein